MTEPIRVVIVDDIAETRDHLSKLLSFETDIDVVGQRPPRARRRSRWPGSCSPDVVLMDINMPGMDGIATTEQLAIARARRRDHHDERPGRGGLPAPLDARRRARVPGQAVQLRRAVRRRSARSISASARSSTACRSRPQCLGQRPRRAGAPRARARSSRVFSPKGGVGRTTLAVNFAVAAADRAGQARRARRRRPPVRRRRRAAQPEPQEQVDRRRAARDDGQRRLDTLDTTLVEHTHRRSRAAGAAQPGDGRAGHAPTTSAQDRRPRCATTHDLVVVDCWPLLQDATLAFLDQSDVILAVLTLEITNIKNIRQFLALADQLGYPDDKVRLRAQPRRLRLRHPRRRTSRTRSAARSTTPSCRDGRTVVYALNRGVPFVWSNKQAQVSEDIVDDRQGRASAEAPAAAPRQRSSRSGSSLFARR